MCDFSCYGGPSAEWLAVQATLPDPSATAGQSLLERRRITNQTREDAARTAMESLARKVEMHDYMIATRDGQAIEARSYRPVSAGDERLPVYMHLHGGGFLFGTLASEDATCARLAINTNIVVLNVNYRHTPEFAYPVPFEDAEDSFIWLHDKIDLLRGNSERVILGGISAGAQLAASLTLKENLATTRSCPPIAGQVLMIPALVHIDCYTPQMAQMRDPSISSHAENRNAPILPRETINMFLGLLVDKPDVKDLRLNPGNATADQIGGLPPTTFGIAGLDPLRDEGLLYAKLLSESG